MASDRVEAAFGWLQVALGTLWLLLTGGCTLVFGGNLSWALMTGNAGQYSSQLFSSLAISIVVGAIGSLPGVAFLRSGVLTLRRLKGRT